MPDCCKKPYDDIITTIELNTLHYLFEDIPQKDNIKCVIDHEIIPNMCMIREYLH